MAGYIAPLPKGVTREHVRYFNRFGIALASDLYRKEGETGKTPAVVIGPPFRKSSILPKGNLLASS